MHRGESNMEFVNIGNLDPRTKSCCIKEGTKMVNNKDIYIREKQKEIFEYYLTARMFLMQANCIDERVIMGLLNKDDYDPCRSTELDLKGNFYECALFYYNVLIDLSWVLAYVSLEFACSINGQRVSTEGIDWISKSKAYLEEFEKNVKNPQDPTSPFRYFEKSTSAKNIIKCISNFWDGFYNSEIRRKYNYAKHRGKLAYQEIIKIENENGVAEILCKDKQLPINTNDVRKEISLYSSIQELQTFDNENLYPYIDQLFHIIEEEIQISEMVMVN